MKYVILIIVAMFLVGCRVSPLSIEKAKVYVEAAFGQATFVHQNSSNECYDLTWYLHDMDTIVTTYHQSSGWDITSSNFVSIDSLDSDKYAHIIVAVQRFRGQNFTKESVDPEPTPTANSIEKRIERKQEETRGWTKDTNWADDWLKESLE